MTKKYTFQITDFNGETKRYSLNPEGFLYFVITNFKMIIAILLTMAVIFFGMKWMAEDTAKCFEENSHLTLREQKAVCTWDA